MSFIKLFYTITIIDMNGILQSWHFTTKDTKLFFFLLAFFLPFVYNKWAFVYQIWMFTKFILQKCIFFRTFLSYKIHIIFSIMLFQYS